jgi:tetratricopeptide (TPR) repeat protein
MSYIAKNQFDFAPVRRFIFIILTAVGFGIGLLQLGLFDNPMTKFQKVLRATKTTQDLEKCIHLCPQGKELACRVLLFTQLTKIKPDVLEHRAKLAIALTQFGHFQKAQTHYEYLLTTGFSSAEFFAHMGKNQETLRKYDAAAESYSRAIALRPELVEVVQSLSRVLVKLDRNSEALSLIESFIKNAPGSESYLHNQKKQIQKQQTYSLSVMRLMSVNGLPHYLPIIAAQSNRIFGLAVVKDSSVLIMSTEMLHAVSKSAFQKAVPSSLILASGQTIKGFITQIPELQIGGWKLKNVNAQFCDECANTIGSSVLQTFSTRTVQHQGVEILEIWKI